MDTSKLSTDGSPADPTPPELLLKLNKQYWQYHDKIEAQQTRFKANPLAEQINVAFTKYILPVVKKAATKGVPTATLNRNQINLDFIKPNLHLLEHECAINGLKLETTIDPNWPSELKAITISGWAEKFPPKIAAKLEKHEPTLTERVIELEKLIKSLTANKSN